MRTAARAVKNVDADTRQAVYLAIVAASFDVDGDRFGWREQGRGDVVVLLHGLGGSRLSWEPQMAGLSDTMRVVAWDMPGYGTSLPLDGAVTFAALADAVAEFIGELGVNQAHVVGISFGGMIAQYAASAHTGLVASLTLLATSPTFGLDGTDAVEWRARRLAPLDAGQEPIDFADAVLGALAGPSITVRALAGQRAAMARITSHALRTSIDCLVTHDSRPMLANITALTLCLVGALDDETPPAYSELLARLIPCARVEVVPGAGHLLNVEAPVVVNSLIRAHIKNASQ